MKGKSNLKLPSLSTISFAMIALAIGWSRHNVSSLPRTAQSGVIRSSKIANDGFTFKIIERANNSEAVPTSVIEQWVYPGCSGAYKQGPGSPPLHIHWDDDELFEVKEGRMGYHLDGKDGILEAGETAMLPAGKPHTWWNAQPDQVLWQRFKLINRSGKYTPNERFFELWASNAYDHGSLDNVNPLQLILMLQAGHVELAVPAPVRLFIRYIICPFAELLGYKRFYHEYFYV